MRCYFLRGGQVAGVNMLPDGLSDQDALRRAETPLLKRRGPTTALRCGTAPLDLQASGMSCAGSRDERRVSSSASPKRI
jgi:hypothetical protein